MARPMTMFGAPPRNALAALTPQQPPDYNALAAPFQFNVPPQGYDTKLSPADEARFQTWLRALPQRLQETNDYDMRGAFKANAQEAANGHLTDTYKKPNHITYSDESIYSHAAGAPPAGTWFQGPGGKWFFWAAPTNITNAGGVTGLQNYFSTAEPDSGLILPPLGQIPRGSK